MLEKAKRHPFVIMFTVISLIVSTGFYAGSQVLKRVERQQEQSNEQQERLNHQQDLMNAETIARRVEGCETANNSRQAIQTVLEHAQVQSLAPFFAGFQDVEGWEDLDWEMKLFLKNVESELFSGVGSTYIGEILTEYQKTNPILDCSLVEKQARKELGLTE